MSTERRNHRRADPLHQGRRRYGRVPLEVDWLLESKSTSTWGHGLEISPRNARLPIARQIDEPVLLYVSLPGRPRMFKARGHVTSQRKGLVIRFDEVSDDDLKLLGACLIQLGGLTAIPQLDLKFRRFTQLPRRFLGTST